MKIKLIRITTVPQSLRGLLKGQLKFMSENGYDVVGVSSGDDVLDEVGEKEGVRVFAVEMTRVISPLKDLKALWQLYKFFKKEKPNIVHTHTPKAGTLGMIAARLAGVPNRLHTVAGLPLLVVKGRKRKLLNFVEKITYSCATAVYPNSYGLYEIILDNKFTSKRKLKVIGNGSSNGIDTTFFDSDVICEKEKNEIKNQLDITKDDFVFIYVGRIVKDKGINELIDAFKTLNSEYKNTKLLLVGSFDQNLNPISENSKFEIDNNKSILSVGYKNDVRPFFSISDLFVFPSYREGFPNVVMQANAMRVTSIVTNINGCNELVKENENGFIVPVGDSKILYEKMVYLYLNKDENHRMAQKGRALVCDNFERSHVWNEILNEYKSL